MALAPGLRRLDLTPLRGREARTWLRGIDILSAQDCLHCRAQVGLRRGGRRRGGRCGGAHEKLAVEGVEGVVDRLAGGDEVLQVRLAGETRRGLVHAPPHLAGAERLPHRMGGSHAVSTLQGPHERVGGVDHERDAAPRHLAVSVGGKGLEEVEDVLLGAVEGAVELDAGIAVVGVEPGEKVEVVGMDGLRGLGQAGVSRRIVVHCRILGACRSVAAVRGLMLPRPRGLISGHARGRWNFTAVSLTRAPFAGSADRIPNPALPRKPKKRQLGPPSPGGSRAPPSRAVGRGVPRPPPGGSRPVAAFRGSGTHAASLGQARSPSGPPPNWERRFPGGAQPTNPPTSHHPPPTNHPPYKIFIHAFIHPADLIYLFRFAWKNVATGPSGETRHRHKDKPEQRDVPVCSQTRDG